MKTLNIIWESLVPFIVACICWYLVGSFMCVSLNPADWSEHDRQFTVFMSALWGAALYFKLQMERYE